MFLENHDIEKECEVTIEANPSFNFIPKIEQWIIKPNNYFKDEDVW